MMRNKLAVIVGASALALGGAAVAINPFSSEANGSSAEATALIDQGVAQLKLTTVSYPKWLQTNYSDRSATAWGKAFASFDAAKLALVEVPPPTTTITTAPPPTTTAPPPTTTTQPPPTQELTPTPRANTVVNAPSGTVAQSNTFYKDPLGTIVVGDNLTRVTITGIKRFPTTNIKNWVDVWIEGSASVPMEIGPRSDGGDGLQIKRYPSTSPLPSDLTFRYFRMHDITRPAGSGKHSDGLQLMAGRRIKFIDGVVERVDTQPFFVRDSGSAAGGGPIEDITFERIKVTGSVEAFYTWNIAGDGDANVPTRVKIIDCSGDKNYHIDASAAAKGSVAINYTRF